MKLVIPKDVFSGNPMPPRLFLCTQSGKRISELQGYDVNLNAKWNSYSELTFSIDRQYVDVLMGISKINPSFDKAETLRQVLAENIGYFIIQDQDDSLSDKNSREEANINKIRERLSAYKVQGYIKFLSQILLICTKIDIIQYKK